MHTFKKLLQNIKLLQDKYAQLNKEEAHDFNIFSLLLESGDEVNLHSKFISELLNPKGTHHQGDVFLQLFLEILKIEINSNNFEVFREKEHIDILIQSSSHSIIIENKIYTKDHSNQLRRYWKNIRKQGYEKSNISFVYLTLFGHQPTTDNLPFIPINLSYRKDMLSWLEQSCNAVKHIPSLHETILQYINLVKKLTYQSKKQGLIMDIKNLLLEEDNLKMLLNMESSIIEAKIEVQFNFWQTLLSQLFPYYAFSFYNSNNDKGLKKSIRRYYQQRRNTKDYGIKYRIHENLNFFIELRDNIYYGFEFLDESKITQEDYNFLNSLNVSWNEVSNGIYWKYPTKYLNFQDFQHQNIFDLIEAKKREKQIEKISNEIINLISSYEKESLCLEK